MGSAFVFDIHIGGYFQMGAAFGGFAVRDHFHSAGRCQVEQPFPRNPPIGSGLPGAKAMIFCSLGGVTYQSIAFKTAVGNRCRRKLTDCRQQSQYEQ